jgi:hypothetical protein
VEPWESKLADEELLHLSGTETASVIVQLELPGPEVVMERERARQDGRASSPSGRGRV